MPIKDKKEGDFEFFGDSVILTKTQKRGCAGEKNRISFIKFIKKTIVF